MKPIQTIHDLTLDPKNANLHTNRGKAAIRHSLREYGAGRSVLADKNGTVIAGNCTTELAQDGDLDVIVVQTDGTQLVVVQRTDLDLNDPKAKALAVADNRTVELDLAWDSDQLIALSKDIELTPFFTATELGAIALAADEDTPEDVPEGNYREQYAVIVICTDEKHQEQIYNKLVGQGMTCRVVNT